MKRRLYRLCFVILLICGGYISWQPEISALKTQNPRETAFMRLRENQSREQGKPFQKNHIWASYDRISTHLIHAVIVAEDASFYQHEGIDFEGLKEAIRKNWERGRWGHGGSTITQQLAKNLFLSPTKNPLRKAKEALIAWRLDKQLSKHRIMEIYLNVVEWGPGVFGAEAASLYHFGKHADELNPYEAATLAALLPSPVRYSKERNARYIERMAKTILIRMEARKFLPEGYFESFQVSL